LNGPNPPLSDRRRNPNGLHPDHPPFYDKHNP